MIRDDPGERLYFFRTKGLAGVEVLAAYGSFQPWHVFHENYAFCACRTATSEFRYRHNTHSLDNGSLMMLEPGELHYNTVVHRRSDFKAVFISPTEFEKVARELEIPGTAHFRFAENKDPQSFAAIYTLSEAIEANDTLLRQQWLLDMCVRRLLNFAERKPILIGGGYEHRAVARAKAYLEEKCEEAVTLDELSAIAGVSRFRLAHAFTKEVGIPPHAYQIHVRIARAQSLLIRGMPQADVAAGLGFTDQSHFARHFKRIWRVTPGEYAAAALR
jgi:AraC-like DNA-binding protein